MKAERADKWFELVVDGGSYHYETLDEAKEDRESWLRQGKKVEDEIYRDYCLPGNETYFIGDPSLVINQWEDKQGKDMPLDNGVYVIEDGTSYALYRAKNGPGSYYDEEGSIFSTKSGFFVIFPMYNEYIDDLACEELQEDGEAHIIEPENPIDTGIDRQCEGAIDFGGYPFIFTGDECWYEEE